MKMERRGFLSLLVGGVMAPFMPKVPVVEIEEVVELWPMTKHLDAAWVQFDDNPGDFIYILNKAQAALFGEELTKAGQRYVTVQSLEFSGDVIYGEGADYEV